MQNPFDLFNTWYNEELQVSTVDIPQACTLSTIGLDSYPNARSVSLKDVRDNAFLVTGPINSRKGMEMLHTPKAALTFWWTETKRQIRIQGDAVLLPSTEADTYFNNRDHDFQLVTELSEQGAPIEDISLLENKFLEERTKRSNEAIPRPDFWGGFLIKPIRIEFMQFEANRFHKRTLCEFVDGEWMTTTLQP